MGLVGVMGGGERRGDYEQREFYTCMQLLKNKLVQIIKHQLKC